MDCCRCHSVLLYFIIYHVGIYAKGTESCAYFESEYFQNGSVSTVNENTTYTITFSLRNQTCLNLEFYFIQIYKFESEKKTYDLQCNIRQRGEACSVSTYRDIFCECTSTFGVYNFTRTFVRADSTTWKWSTVNIISNDLIIQFNVIYSAKLESLTLNDFTGPGPHIVQENESVRVVCTWANGNPPSTIRLLHGTGQTLHNINDTFGNISFHISSAGWRDSGTFICEAEDSTQSLSTTLLVNCSQPFKEIFYIYSGYITSEQAETNLLFRSQTQHITQCRLSKIHDAIGTYDTLLNISSASYFHKKHVAALKEINNIFCETIHVNYLHQHNQKDNCFCNVSGYPPDLTLTLHIYASTMHIAGLWSLAVVTLGTEFYYNILFHSSYGGDQSTVSHRYLASEFVTSVICTMAMIIIILIVTIIIQIFVYRQRTADLDLSNQAENYREKREDERNVLINGNRMSRSIAFQTEEDFSRDREVVIINNIYERSGDVISQEIRREVSAFDPKE